MPITPTRFTIDVPGSDAVDAALIAPESSAPNAVFVFAHGAGAGMRHPFMVQLSLALVERGIATLRFQFPFMQKQVKRPDSPAVAQAAIRAAVREAAQRLPGVPLYAGGKSFGGRMTSGAQANEPLPGVRGLIFVGFPLHPPKAPGIERAAHLAKVTVPMVFVQGTRDELAELPLIREVTASLGPRAALHVVEGGDHSFEVLVRSGRNEDEVRAEIADAIAGWVAQLNGRAASPTK